jgi:hypothetical protein
VPANVRIRLRAGEPPDDRTDIARSTPTVCRDLRNAATERVTNIHGFVWSRGNGNVTASSRRADKHLDNNRRSGKTTERQSEMRDRTRELMKASTITTIAVLLSLAISSGALADDTEQPDEAKAAFDEGAALFAQGDFSAAAEAFRRAYEIKPSWRLLYNIGQSEAAAKRHGLAMEAFEKYLSQGGDDVDEARRAEVSAELERMRPIVGTVEIVAPAGSLVVIDEVERGQTPLPGRLKVAAGVEHQVEVLRGDLTLLARTVSVGGRENQLIEVPTEDSPAPAVTEPAVGEDEPIEEPEQPEETDVPAEPKSALATAGWVMIGTGGALAITGGVTGLVALSRNDQLVSACNDEDGCDPEDWGDVRDKRDAMATTSTVMFAVGAAAATAGVIMLVVDRRSDDEEMPHQSEPEISVAPSAGPGFAGLGLNGRF